MGALYALVVGINSYWGRLHDLNGAVGDAEDVVALLGEQASTVVLLGHQATKAAIVAAFRQHLGRAQRGDSALFYFAGHGSEMPTPPCLRHTESSGMVQTLVCADSRTPGVTDLLDKELAVLLAEVARGGAHVAAVLDCCNSAGSTRGRAEEGVRGVEPHTSPAAHDELLPELTEPTRSGAILSHAPTHVLLAACDIHEKAGERRTARGIRGVFSEALLTKLGTLPTGVTYRELAGSVACSVENFTRSQRPVLRPVENPLVDQPFLGGAYRGPLSGTIARHLRGEWRIDAGACHGITAGTPRSPVEFGVASGELSERFRVVGTTATASTVVPVGWEPDAETQYPVVLTAVPLPECAVAVGNPEHAALATAVATAATGGTPSPHVRLVGTDHPFPSMQVVGRRPGVVDVVGGDGVPYVTGLPSDDPAAVVRTLEHIARWQRARTITNPVSALTGAIRLEIVFENGTPVPTDQSGVLQLAYRDETAPRVLVRLRNTHDRNLFCALLDLTDGFGIHPDLMPGSWVRAHYVATAADGWPIELGLPAGRPVLPGASTRDWFLLLVSELPFSTEPFRLPELGEPEQENSRSAAITGVIDRLGFTALHRQARVVAPAADWTTSIVALRTFAPD
jgi:hypothetical protein